MGHEGARSWPVPLGAPMTAAGIELNLPDLPEVPIQLGPVPGGRPPPPREMLPWSLRLRLRLRDILTSYLPLLLMLVLALGTWWLVKNSPGPLAPREATAARTDPDYTMTGFSVQRFAADGRLKVRLEGQRMRHFPATDRIEIDTVTIRAFAPDGRVTVATAQRALANGDATEVQLLGGATVRSDSQTASVDGAGIYALHRLVPGNHTLKPNSTNAVFLPKTRIVNVIADTLDVDFHSYRYNALLIERLGAGHVRNTFAREPFASYSLEVSTALSNWTYHGAITTDADGLVSWTETNSPAPSGRFFRVRRP